MEQEDERRAFLRFFNMEGDNNVDEDGDEEQQVDYKLGSNIIPLRFEDSVHHTSVKNMNQLNTTPCVHNNGDLPSSNLVNKYFKSNIQSDNHSTKVDNEVIQDHLSIEKDNECDKSTDEYVPEFMTKKDEIVSYKFNTQTDPLGVKLFETPQNQITNEQLKIFSPTLKELQKEKTKDSVSVFNIQSNKQVPDHSKQLNNELKDDSEKWVCYKSVENKYNLIENTNLHQSIETHEHIGEASRILNQNGIINFSPCKSLSEIGITSLESVKQKDLFKPNGSNESNPHIKTSNNTGFIKCGSGERVNISESAMNKAKSLFQDEDFNVPIQKESNCQKLSSVPTFEIPTKSKELNESNPHLKTSNNTGFIKCGSGERVNISESAMNKAKSLFQDEDFNVPIQKESNCQKLSSVPTFEIPTKSKELNESNPHLKTYNNTGFIKCGSGERVNISESAMNKAKSLFQDKDFNVPIQKESNCQKLSSVPTFEIPTKSKESNESNPHLKTSNNTGFIKCGSGERVNISESAMNKAKSLFQDEDFNVPIQKESNCQKLSSVPTFEIPTKSKELNESNPHLKTSNNTGFIKCGSGERVNISESAMNKAKSLFQDEDFNVPIQKESNCQKLSSVPTFEIPTKSKELNESNPHLKTSNNTGFIKCGSGERVNISESAMNKAKSLFQDEDFNVLIQKESNCQKLSSVPTFEIPTKSKESNENNLHLKTSNNTGFIKCGSGERVNISESAMNKAKSLIQGENIPKLFNQVIDNVDSSKTVSVCQNESFNSEDDTFGLDEFNTQFLEEVEKTEEKYFNLKRKSPITFECSPNKKCNSLIYKLTDDKVFSDFQQDLFKLRQKLSARICLKGRVLKSIPDTPGFWGQLNTAINNQIKFEEIRDLFLSIPSIESSKVDDSWIANHYRWIFSYLHSLSSQTEFHYALTPSSILWRLKYRYDREIAGSCRSALKKIYEGDDSPSKPIILFIASIHSDTIELSDGWYSIHSILKPSISTLIRMKKIKSGTKLYIEGAEIEKDGSHGNCKPLEDEGRTRLNFSVNSCRRARWWAKLGFHAGPRLTIKLNSIKEDGGLVARVKVIIRRRYPLIYMEKKESKITYINEKVYNKKMHAIKKSKEEIAEKIYSQVQKDLEEKKRLSLKKKAPFRHGFKIKSQKSNVEELYNLIETYEDPSILESLSSSQVEELKEFKLKEYENFRNEIRHEVEARLTSFEETSSAEYVPVLRLKISDESPDMIGTLSLWKPSHDLLSLLQENRHFFVYRISANKVFSDEINLSSVKSTLFREVSKDFKISDYFGRSRSLASILDIVMGEYDFKSNFNEVDFVGVIVQVSDPRGSNEKVAHDGYGSIYVSDLMGNFVRIRFWNSLKDLGMETLVHTTQVIYFRNLRFRAKDSSLKEIPSLFMTEQTEALLSSKDPFVSSIITEFMEGVTPNFVEESVHLLSTLLGAEVQTPRIYNDKLSKGVTPTLNERAQIVDPQLSTPFSKIEIVSNSPAALQSSRNKSKLLKLKRITYPDASPLFPLTPLPNGGRRPLHSRSKMPRLPKKRSKLSFEHETTSKKESKEESQEFEEVANLAMDHLEMMKN